MKRVSTAPTTPALTPTEERILAAFRAMDQQARNEYVIKMEWSAKKYPHRVGPMLRLLKGGAS